jgi:Spy/CpxP family protein refolding chaperone
MPRDAGSKRLVAWGLAVLLLAIGAAGGMAADRLLARGSEVRERRGPPSPDELLERMKRDLDLTEPQSRAVRDALEDRQRALSKLFARVDPEAEVIRAEANTRIRAVLDPTQRARFDDHVAALDRRRAEVRERFREARSPGAAPRE